MQDSHSASTPVHPSFTFTIYHSNSQQMRSFNTGHECWCALSPSLKEEPLWFQVQSMASKEFVTGMDILIGSLTFGRTPSDNLMSQFFCLLHTHLTTSSYALFPPITRDSTHKSITLCPCFCPSGSVERSKKIGVDFCEAIKPLID